MIKKTWLAFTASAIFALAFATGAHAQAYFNGTGIDDGHFTTSTGVGSLSTVSVSLRGRNYGENVFPEVSPGVFQFNGGNSPINAARTDAQLDFSVSSDLLNDFVTLGKYNWRLGVDINSGPGQSYLYYDIMTALPDNALGKNGTVDGGEVYENQPGIDFMQFTVGQNSGNLKFAYFGVNVFVPGAYTYTLGAYEIGDSTFAHAIASTSLTFSLGEQAPQPPVGAVPEPSTYGLFGGLGLIGYIVCERRRRNRVKKAQSEAQLSA